MRLTFALFQMSQIRAAKRVCKKPGTKAYYLTKSCNDVARREWMYRDGAARKVLGDRNFALGDDMNRDKDGPTPRLANPTSDLPFRALIRAYPCTHPRRKCTEIRGSAYGIKSAGADPLYPRSLL